MSNHPIIKALQEELESDIERLVESHTKWFIENTGYSVTNTRVQDEIYDYENTIRKGHEAATARLMTIIEKAVEMATFYANWSNMQDGIVPLEDCETMFVYEPLDKDKNGVTVGGKKAREFLTTLKEQK